MTSSKTPSVSTTFWLQNSRSSRALIACITIPYFYAYERSSLLTSLLSLFLRKTSDQYEKVAAGDKTDGTLSFFISIWQDLRVSAQQEGGCPEPLCTKRRMEFSMLSLCPHLIAKCKNCKVMSTSKITCGRHPYTSIPICSYSEYCVYYIMWVNAYQKLLEILIVSSSVTLRTKNLVVERRRYWYTMKELSKTT